MARPIPHEISTSADQVVDNIVKTIVGRIGPAGADGVAEAAHILAQPPHTPNGRRMLLFCRAFERAYKNWNYDCRDNGEFWLIKQMSPYCPRVVFDVGANLGDWLSLASSSLQEASLHAFEIVDATAAQLHQKFADNKAVVVNRFGLSDRNGTTTMYLFDASNQLTSHVPYPHGSYHEISCFTRRGDEYLLEHKIERIDLLKIDVEGAEHLVLDGFSGALKDGRIDLIQFEYGRLNILTHFLLRDFYAMLEGYGYAVGKLFPDHVDFRAYSLEDEDFIGPNYVAVRKQRPEIIDMLDHK